jgi:hypothetical protein
VEELFYRISVSMPTMTVSEAFGLAIHQQGAGRLPEAEALYRQILAVYPTMRLFRQPKFGDWPSVIQRVTEELAALVSQQG